MSYAVSFPGLGLSFNLNAVAFTIFGLTVNWYGVIITCGMILAVVFAMSQAKSFGIDSDRMLDVVLVGIVVGVLGARLYFIAFFEEMNFSNFLNIRGGGLAIYGGIIGAALAVMVVAPLRKVPVLPLMDLTGMGFLIGQSIGRWGNFFNQEAFGTNTTLPWGMISNGTTNYLLNRQSELAAQGIIVDPYSPVHPTFLYESLWCALGFSLLFLYRKHRKFNGELALFYVIWYGAGRFWIEGLRTDSLMIQSLNVRVSQLLAATCVLLGIVVWVMARVKTKGKPLQVPAIPLRTAKVKVDGQTVVISWPGGEKEPKESQKQEMAQAVLQANAEKLQSETAEKSEKVAKPQALPDGAVSKQPLSKTPTVASSAEKGAPLGVDTDASDEPAPTEKLDDKE